MRTHLIATLLLSGLAVTAWGQAHTDVYVVEQSGALTTNGFGCPDNGCLAGEPVEARVFANTLGDFNGLGNPGFRALGGDLPGRLDVSWDFMPMTVDSGSSAGLTSTLLYWDGLGPEVDFGAPPTIDYAIVFQGKDNLTARADSSDQIVPGAVAFSSTPAGSTHTHGFFLVDSTADTFDGQSDPDPGIYLTSMRLRADTLDETDPFFVMFRTQEASLSAPFGLAQTWVNDRVDTLADLLVEDVFPGDFNTDGAIDNADLNLLLNNWGEETVDPDWTAALTPPVNNDELNALLNGWGFGTGAAVPEPGTGVLIGLAATFVVGAGRRRD
ncbi:MAG: PEP-CTERM sorting domain-containing protein [Planctomycetota bacterium]